MSDWKRAGSVSFGSGVRCKEFVTDGATFTVYCEASDTQAVLNAIFGKPEVQADDLQMVGNGEPEQIVKTDRPLTAPVTKPKPKAKK